MTGKTKTVRIGNEKVTIKKQDPGNFALKLSEKGDGETIFVEIRKSYSQQDFDYIRHSTANSVPHFKYSLVGADVPEGFGLLCDDDIKKIAIQTLTAVNEELHNRVVNAILLFGRMSESVTDSLSKEASIWMTNEQKPSQVVALSEMPNAIASLENEMRVLKNVIRKLKNGEIKELKR